MTDKKLKILRYIESRKTQPTQQEIADYFGNTISTINQHLQEMGLSDGNLVKWRKNKKMIKKCPFCKKACV